ncbi:MAG: phenylacetate--CoA ligase, partial [Bacteroidaceae bacterium]|nr:phenylacetate--CoA ligase [Bacteroidaceae bacterium]
MIYNPERECMSREELKKLQSEQLVRIVAHTYQHVPFYRQRMDEAGVKPADIKSIDDIVKLPFTTKKDLRDTYPNGLFAVPNSEIVRLHASSGTTGKPIVAAYTQHDLDNWAEGTARCLTAYGATKEDIVQVSYGYGLFTGGLGAHDGATRLGAMVLPTSSGNTAKQIMLMQDIGCTGLCCTPSYALYLAEEIERMGVKDNIQLRWGAFGAEPWTEAMRKELEEKLHIKAYDLYGLTEVSGPGVGGECECQDGTHLWEDMFYPEIIDPVTGEQLPEGCEGELVFTTLDKWGMPMIRYRTRDLTHLNYARCKCGRTMVRMGKILGRSDDMLIIRGVNVFPSQVESVILELPEFQGQYFITVDRVNNVDTFDIDVELRPEYYSDDMNVMLGLMKKLRDRLLSVIGIKPSIHIVEPNSIERSQGKAKHVNDKR